MRRILCVLLAMAMLAAAPVRSRQLKVGRATRQPRA